MNDLDEFDPQLLDSLGHRRAQVGHESVRAALSLIDLSGAPEMLAQWRAEDKEAKGPGGRPALVSDRAALTLMLLLAIEHSPLYITRMADLAARRLTPEAKTLLGLSVSTGSEFEWYHRISRSLARALKVVDPLAAPRRRRMNPTEREEVLSKRDPNEAARKQARLDALCNALLHATYLTLPRDVRRSWKGNSCIDATFVAAFGKRGTPKKKSGFVAIEPDAGWYVRTGDHSEGSGNDKYGWGWEAHTIVAAANDPEAEATFPLIILGMTFDKPAGRVTENTMTAYASMAKRGYPTGYAVGDRAYFNNGQPERLQLPMRKMGYRLVMDYKRDQLGVQDTFAGAIQVEGAWYCPKMPKRLIEATLDFIENRIDEETYSKRVDARKRYAAKPKSHPDADGYVRYMHPSDADGAVCDHGRDHAPKFCTQKSVSFPPMAGAKFA